MKVFHETAQLTAAYNDLRADIDRPSPDLLVAGRQMVKILALRGWPTPAPEVRDKPGYVLVNGVAMVGSPTYLDRLRLEGRLPGIAHPNLCIAPCGTPSPSPMPTSTPPSTYCNPGNAFPPPCDPSGPFHRMYSLSGFYGGVSTITTTDPLGSFGNGFAFMEGFLSNQNNYEGGLQQGLPNVFQVYAAYGASRGNCGRCIHFDGTRSIRLFVFSFQPGGPNAIVFALATGFASECGCNTIDGAAVTLPASQYVASSWARMTSLAQVFGLSFTDGEHFGPVAWTNNKLCSFVGVADCRPDWNFGGINNWPDDPTRIIIPNYPGDAGDEFITLDMHP